ncbi:hypothetical protein ILUMI_13805 [Ignelater luminosus]|uniref:Odorant receptor n=1 Tax=Ignelater luminosus TaxID=2038154 RepID=A0A8K0CTQ6_IGNLU|nr:hypothetical protein ILUMI_13805 [Ignelater luminosus]
MKRITNDDGIKLQRAMLLTTGMWPKQFPNRKYRIWNTFNYILAFLMFTCLLRTFFILKDFSSLVQNWNIFITFAGFCIKISIVYLKRSKFLKLLDFMNNKIFESHDFNLNKHMNHSINISNSILRLFQFSAGFTLMCMFLHPLFEKKHRQLPFEFCLDATEDSVLFYVMWYVIQVAALSSAGCSTVGLDSVVCSMMGLVAAHFRILGETVSSTTNLNSTPNNSPLSYGESDEKINEKLSRCVELHLAIINFAEFIDDIFSYCFLCQFLSSAFNMITMGFVFTITTPGSTEFILSFTFLSSTLIQISIFCAYGNEVIIESLKVHDACYMTEWTYCGPKVRKTLFFVMECAKRPVVLTAGKFVDLSLASLVSIFRAAVSYGTVLRQLYYSK